VNGKSTPVCWKTTRMNSLNKPCAQSFTKS
jgi:hypothetical protein